MKLKFISTFILSMVMLLASKLYGEAPLTVNVDNPSFRKLVIALPPFTLESGEDSPIAQALKDHGQKELTYLLNFSGYFNVISQEAYADYIKKMIGERRAKDQAAWLSQASTLTGDELVQWKAISVESLTLASIALENKDVVLTVKSFDTNQGGKEILAKQFKGVIKYQDVIRTYADALLEHYTGKPGIFSSKLAFVGRRDKGDAKQIYISDFDGSNLEQVTTGNVPHLSPAWSPDGRYLAYTSFEKGSADIFIYDTITKSTRRLTTQGHLNSGANWSPDGTSIAFTSAKGGDTDIYIIPAKGGKKRLLIKGSGLDVDPKFSPDGKMIAFVSGRYGNPHIFVGQLSHKSSKYKVVSDRRLTYAGWYNSTPDWSPESDKIAFGGYDKDIDRYDIFMMNRDGTKLERLTLKTGDNESPSWSPNGQMLVFQSSRVGASNVKGPPALYFMNRDGSSQRRLDIPLYNVQTPDWSGPRKFD